MDETATARAAPRRRRRIRVVGGGILIVAVACLTLVGAMLLEARSLRVTRVTFSGPDVPPAFDGLRIAFVADIHYGSFVSRARVGATVDRVNALHPDLIVLGGDYIYGKQSATDLRPVFEELSRLRAPLGVYGVLGNHDHALLEESAGPGMEAAGIHELNDSGVWLRGRGSRLRLSGMNGLTEDRQSLAEALDGATARDFVLLVDHSPDVVETLAGTPVDLVLAGHTHGGQVTAFGLWAPLVPSRYGDTYRQGLVTDGPVPVFVTTGVGTIVAPLRFYARPEVVLLTLRRTEARAPGDERE
jgi:predicted MPP superfamily phosphohydrolase